MEIYGVRDLTFSYPGESTPALSGVSFSVEAGEFITFIGPSGSGKSTLLRQLKPELAAHGTRSGEITFCGTPLDRLVARERAAKIGFVMQDPDNQIVTDKVWHELAFGLESLGADTAAIRRRTAEMAGFFGIEEWFHRDVSSLSGGQKQLLNLASVMVTEPEVLILDEPTSQLDPIAAADFLAALGRVNRELGTTILLTEHRLEDVLPLSHRVLVLSEGQVLCQGSARSVGETLRQRGSTLFTAMPAPMRVWAAVEQDLPCPVTVTEGRKWLENYAEGHPMDPIPPRTARHAGPTALELSEVWFRYEKNGGDVLRGLNFDASFGELLCILGGNGAGKSTALSILSGGNQPYRGEVRAAGRTALLPQEARMLFARNSVREELAECAPGEEELRRVIRLCRLAALLDRHPYDLSGGEAQRCALAKVLLGQPEILLLDEPTKGLDAGFKEEFAAILKALTARGVCVVMVSHDVEFCAEYADRCALFFDGSVVATDVPERFFTQGSFYTTSANRMARHLLPEAITVRDVVTACGGSLPERAEEPEGEMIPVSTIQKPGHTPLPLWRKALALCAGGAALVTFGYALREVDLTEILATGDLRLPGGGYRGVYGALLLSLLVLALAVGRRETGERDRGKKAGEKLPRRTVAAAGMILLAVPLTILAGVLLLEGRKYYVISMLVILETMLPFILVFEGRRPRARELVVIASLCALGVVGRAAFLAVPGFKPVMAVVIVSGVAFGGETGFLVGAVTMFASNLLYGQGPWTPWQMFAMGIIGFLAGVLFHRGGLGRGRLTLCLYGMLAALVLYGGIMNPASVLMYQSEPTWAMIFTSYLTGFPMDLLHGASTVLFLWLGAEPLLEKLERVKTKYGLVEREE